MAASLDENTKVSFKIPLFVTLAIALVAAGAGYAAKASDVNTLLQNDVERKGQVERLVATDHRHDLEIQRGQDSDAHIIQLLMEVKADLRELKAAKR